MINEPSLALGSWSELWACLFCKCYPINCFKISPKIILVCFGSTKGA